MRMAKTITALKTHKRVIVWSLIFAYAVFLLVHPDESGRFYPLFFGAIPVVLIASQVFWIRRVGKLGKRLISRSSNVEIRVLLKAPNPPGYCADCSRPTGKPV